MNRLKFVVCSEVRGSVGCPAGVRAISFAVRIRTALAACLLLLAAFALPLSADAAPLKITSVSPVNGSVIVRWEGGAGPYQLLCRTNMSQPWRKVGAPTSGFSATNPAPAGSMCFFLVTTDLTPPSVPTGLSASAIGCGELRLTWNAANDNAGGSGLRGYQLFRNGQLVKFIPGGTNATVESGLSPTATYSYRISALDWAGSESAQAPAVAAMPACPNVPPIAASGPPSTNTTVGSPVAFDASASRDVDGTILSYNWNFGDGATASGLTVSHAYSAVGTYFVRLTVTDNMGAASSDTTLVSVAAAPPPGQLVSVGTIGSTDVDYAQGVATDPAGNVFVGGTYASRPYLAKRSPTGGTLWNLSFGPGIGTVNAVATDSGGNVYATGNFYAAEDFGNGVSITSAGGHDIFLAKFSSDGACQWAKRFGSAWVDSYPSEAGLGVAVDPRNDEVVITGIFDGAISFGGAAFVSTCGQDMFLARFNSGGTHLWSRRVGGADFTVGNGVAIDASGNIFVTGSMRSTVDFGRGAVTNSGLTDMFIARYSSAGANVWSKNFGTRSPVATTSVGSGIAVSGNNVIVTGTISSSMQLGGSLLANAGQQDIFLAKYSAADGAHLQSKSFGGTGPDYGSGVAVDGATGRITLTGNVRSSINFGGGLVTAGIGKNAFVANFASDLACRWANIFAASYGEGRTVIHKADGRLLAVGRFSTTASFGPQQFTSAGGSDMFLVEFAP